MSVARCGRSPPRGLQDVHYFQECRSSIRLQLARAPHCCSGNDSATCSPISNPQIFTSKREAIKQQPSTHSDLGGPSAPLLHMAVDEGKQAVPRGAVPPQRLVYGRSLVPAGRDVQAVCAEKGTGGTAATRTSFCSRRGSVQACRGHPVARGYRGAFPGCVTPGMIRVHIRTQGKAAVCDRTNRAHPHHET